MFNFERYTSHIHICKRNPQKYADSTSGLRIPPTICGFRLQLRNPHKLNLTIQMSYDLFLVSSNCSGFRNYGCGFRKIAYF